MPILKLTADRAGERADAFLARAAEDLTRSAAQRLLEEGGVTVNDEKVSAIDATFGCEQFTGDGVIIRKGKKVFHRAVLV